MDNLDKELDTLKHKYRKAFLEEAENFCAKVTTLKPQELDGEIFGCYTKNSTGQIWQKKVLNYIEAEAINEIKSKLKHIKTCQKDYHCAGCGVCCKFAVSEFSPDELAKKAQNGDNYAKQFTSTFVPYDDETELEKIFPQYISLLQNNNQTDCYFYHCPKVTKDNRCPDYENRPQICREFPDNPIAFLPLKCGYNEWKQNSLELALKTKAKAEIVEFYKNKIKELLK